MYIISDDEEKYNINQINRSLKQYGKLLNSLASENTNSLIMTLGRNICESIMELVLKKEGHYNPDERSTLFHNTEILYEHSIIPNECRNFIHLIRRYGNQSAHGIEPTDKLALSFLHAFKYFIQWTNNHYLQKYQKNFQIEECCALIDSLSYDEKNKKLKLDISLKEFNSRNIHELEHHKIKANKELLDTQKELKNLKATQKERVNKEVSEKLEKLIEIVMRLEKAQQKQGEKDLKEFNIYNILLKKCLDVLYGIDEREKRIESKIDAISNQITSIQSLTEKQISDAESNEKIERIIESHINKCIDNIMDDSSNYPKDQNYRIEKTKLIYSIGEDGWNKLCEKSKTFLITSKVMYNHLIMMDDIIDYSGICVLVTKALEVEIYRRFFTDFLFYLNEEYGADYKEYPTSLLDKKNRPLSSEKFTMGRIAFVMCPGKNWRDNDAQKRNNKLKLMEYCKGCIFSNYDEDEIKRLLAKYASSIEEIREKYRNPSAHTNEIKRVDAEECFNLVLDVEKLLKKMLDSFDY